MSSPTLIIIIITVTTSIYAWKRPEIQYKWMMTPYKVSQNKEYMRFLTSAFIHANQIHLFFNMFTLYFFGDVIEQNFRNFYGSLGNVVFVAFYLSAVVISDIPTFRKHRKNPYYSSLGASGGVSAVIFASIFFYPLNKICLYGIICMPGIILGFCYVVYTYFQSKKVNDNINHDAHLYGAIYGIVFSIIARPSAIFTFIEQIKSFKLF